METTAAKASDSQQSQAASLASSISLSVKAGALIKADGIAERPLKGQMPVAA